MIRMAMSQKSAQGDPLRSTLKFSALLGLQIDVFITHLIIMYTFGPQNLEK